MSMFADARGPANDRMRSMGMAEEGDDLLGAAPAEDPAAELLTLIQQVPDPGLAQAMMGAVQKLVGGGPPQEAPGEPGPLENDPVVGP